MTTLLKRVLAASNARSAAWEVKQAAKKLLPRRLRYVETVSLNTVREAWPPLKTAIAEPFTHTPTAAQRDCIARQGHFGDGAFVRGPLNLHVIPHGLLFPRTGTLATAKGVLIAESCKESVVPGATHTFNTLKLKPPRSMGDTLISTIEIGSYQTSHGHWLLEALPRLWALSQLNEPVTLVMRSSLNATRRTLLDWVKPDNVTVSYEDSADPVTARRVLLTPFAQVLGFPLMHPQVFSYVQQRVIDGAQRAWKQPREWPRAIYISREKTVHSRVANEAELQRGLQRLNVQSVVLEDLPIEQQVLHFAHAELVVGALSSGLINCMFQRRGSLVEIFAGGERPGTHTPSLNELAICQMGGLAFHPVYHAHVSPEPSFTVDVPRVLAAAEKVLALPILARAQP